MNASPNVNDLAKKFWDLWQEQVATIMNDKDFVQTLLEMMQKSPFNSTSFNNNAQAKDMYANPFFNAAAAPSGGDAAASRAAMAAMDECTKRLAAMERRVELLETALIHAARKPATPAGNARKRPTKPAAAKRAKK